MSTAPLPNVVEWLRDYLEPAMRGAYPSLAETLRNVVIPAVGAQQTDKARGLSQPQRDYCSEKLKPGGCQLHNLHCGYPKCNEPPAHLTERSQVDRCAPLLDALRHIAEPVAWEQDNVREGYELDYPMLMHMLNDPEYYKRVAREALDAAPEPAEQKASQADSRSDEKGEGL